MWGELDHEMAEDFIHKVFKTLYGDHYENYSYDDVLKKIKLLKDYKKIIIEEFIPGQEIQAAIIGSKILGAIELRPKRKFYDYTYVGTSPNGIRPPI